MSPSPDSPEFGHHTSPRSLVTPATATCFLRTAANSDERPQKTRFFPGHFHWRFLLFAGILHHLAHRSGDVLTPGRYVGAEFPAAKWQAEFPAAKWQAEFPATKWRHVVAMGVSPWNRIPQRALSPEGTAGTVTPPIHAAPSGLPDRVGSSLHGFAPVATTCRPCGTNVLTLGRYVGAAADDGRIPFTGKMTTHTATKWQAEFPATKWRHVVAMGISPWNQIPQRAMSPEGTTGSVTPPIHAAPSGLRDHVRSSLHGFAPVATTCRPCGTNVLTLGRYVGAADDDGAVRERRATYGDDVQPGSRKVGVFWRIQDSGTDGLTGTSSHGSPNLQIGAAQGMRGGKPSEFHCWQCHRQNLPMIQN